MLHRYISTTQLHVTSVHQYNSVTCYIGTSVQLSYMLHQYISTTQFYFKIEGVEELFLRGVLNKRRII